MPPALSVEFLTLRSPNLNDAELVITTAIHGTVIYRLNYQQLRLLSVQSTNAMSLWPVREVA